MQALLHRTFQNRTFKDLDPIGSESDKSQRSTIVMLTVVDKLFKVLHSRAVALVVKCNVVHLMCEHRVISTTWRLSKWTPGTWLNCVCQASVFSLLSVGKKKISEANAAKV